MLETFRFVDTVRFIKHYLHTICASKRVRISCCDIIYTIYISLCLLSADPNPFIGTHCKCKEGKFDFQKHLNPITNNVQIFYSSTDNFIIPCRIPIFTRTWFMIYELGITKKNTLSFFISLPCNIVKLFTICHL